MKEYSKAPEKKSTLKLFGIKVNRVDVRQLHRFIRRSVSRRMKSLVLNVNIHCIVLALRESWLKDFLNQAQVVYCDGDGVRWGIRMLGHIPPPKVGFTRWIWDLADFCGNENYSLFLLGGAPGVAEQAAQRLKARAPNLRIAGTHHGYFKKSGEETEKVIELINQSRADVLIVGFGMPLQEKWIKAYWEQIQVYIFLPGGAVLDYAAGQLGQVPQWMLRLHLEWLFRIWEDPKRLAGRYAFDIPYFFLNVIREKMTQTFRKMFSKPLFGTNAEKRDRDRL